MAHAAEQLGVLLHEVVRAEVAARLLVGEQAQDHVAGRGRRARLRAHERCEQHRDPALHVERAASPYVPVLDVAPERRELPLSARGDDVDVALEQQRRAVTTAREPRDQVRPLGDLRDDSDLDAELFEQSGDPRDALALVSGRVRGVEAQQALQELDRPISERLPRHAHSLSRAG